MGWARFDDMRATNRKLRAAGFAARGLDEAGICQCALDMSDGHISRDTVAMLAAAHGERNWRKLVAKLVEVGRWDVNGDGWIIHDYLEYNPTRVEQQELIAERRAAGRAGGLAKARAKARANELAEPLAVSVSRPVVRQSQSPLNPTRPETVSETGPQRAETETNLALMIADLCRGRNRTFVNLEAAAVVAWAERHVDRGLIEESVHWFAQQAKPPDLPRAVAVLIATKAADRHIALPAFQPTLTRI